MGKGISEVLTFAIGGAISPVPIVDAIEQVADPGVSTSQFW